MEERIILALFLSSFLGFNQGCQIGGSISLGPVPQQLFINDTFRGNIISEATTDVVGITGINYGGALVGGPYLDITHVDSQFVVRPSGAFDQYEENEVALFISVTVTFSCTGGSTSPLILVVNIRDTNNNDPQFRPSNDFEFVVAPPLPPGFLVTGCFNDITVRDVDLTTSRIIFEIEDNPYFEIDYDAAASAVAPSKEFKAVLKTSTFIRTLREPVTLRITATDVDATGDPSRTTSGTIRISGDTEFEFPEEPVFTQTFYIAHYTADHQLILSETISLQQGFDANVNFTLDGEYRSYFTLTPTGNQVYLAVSTHLPVEVLAENQIYLIVRADREYTSGASATIVIYLPEETPLLFANALYEGAIVDGDLQLSTLVLVQGYEGATVTAEIVGEHSTRFTANVQGNQVNLSMAPITDSFIDDNSFLTIQVFASTDRSEAMTIVSLEIIKDDNVTPAFDKSIYTGSYDPDNGLNIEPITFIQGFDETVSVELFGEYESLFQIIVPGPTVIVSSSTLPPEIFAEQRITLSIEATKQRTVRANAVIIIYLPAARQLEFGMDTYRGMILDNELSVQNISLSVGYDQNVQFNLSGDHSTYFDVTNVQNQVTITLPGSLPDSVITQNSAIMLTVTATGLNALATTTSILLDILKDDRTTPIFSQNIYHGVYKSLLDFEIDDIFLSQGFDDEVSFRLDDSAHAQYFAVSSVGSNVTIALRSAIPEDVIFEQKVLLFNILADKALTVGSNSAVLIRFPAELIEPTVMKFTKASYVGTFEQKNITVESIILETGYSPGTEFLLLGEYAHHFQLSNTNNEVQISNNITNTLPSDIDLYFIILTVEAQSEGAVPAWASVVIEIVKEGRIYPVFNQAFYRGSYTEENKLQFVENVYLAAGYNENVTFHLQGDYATWFSVSQTGNSVTLVLVSDIPPGILQDNNQLLFSIIALNTNGASARAVISIDLPTDRQISFSQEYYKGYIENDLLTLDAITLQDNSISIDIIPTLAGDYSDYFQIRNLNGSLILEIQDPIPTEILYEKRSLILTLSIPNGTREISTVIVLEVVNAEALPLEFVSIYYVGSYNETQGLEFDNEIRISDDDFALVEFELEGNDAIWFGLVRGENSVQLNLIEAIPPSVITNNQQLIFAIRAERSGSTTVRATIIITLHTGFIERLVLGFDRVSYVGSVNTNESTIETITLIEGYDIPGLVLTLHGDLSGYFDASRQEAAVTVSLDIPIPEQLVPANGIILLGIQATAPEAIPAYATLVLEFIVESNVTSVELVFSRTYYTGTYAPSPGLTFVTPISLAEGYDADVEFSLEGDDAGWFELEGIGNSRQLVLSSPIPTGVLANNQQLVFVVNAQRTGSTTVGSTIVISLEPAFTEGLILGFDRVSYLGSIENNLPTIEPITLREGYDLPGLELELLGELSGHFNAIRQGTAVTVSLDIPIPEQLVPTNGIILLGIQATAPEAIPAYATLVLEFIVESNVTSVELVFSRTYYTGTYAPSPGLTFITPISLAEGYDADVEFSLEGVDAGWFELEGIGNSRQLVLSSPIPTGVLANNQQLVFVVNAQRTGASTVRATIVISLEPAFTEGLILGFDRVSYIGSIENNLPTIEPITLREGYDLPGLELELLGELSGHFNAIRQGTAVTVSLDIPIPEQLVPTNGIILLGIQATAPEAIPAYATLVLEFIVESNVTSVELVFSRTYYTGTYAPSPGLTFITPISLAEGYDADVEFSLEGVDAGWFELEGIGNSRQLVLSSPIPTGVLANNQQLVFVVNAQRTGASTVRATIVISLEPAFTEGLILGFDRVSYLGSIENNLPTIEPITLREGYDLPGLELELLGELSGHFNAIRQGTAVTVSLDIPIPEQLVPTNGIILLGIQATAPEAIPAYATLVLEFIVESNVTSVELVFSRTYYTGTYAPSPGLTFITPISLAEGYDADVEFSLEGVDAGWFELEGIGNSRQLVLSSPIPTGVLANNQQLVFVVNAQRTGASTVRATIVISLEPEFTEGLILGFDRVSYLGSIENNLPTIEPITLREGYDLPGLELELLGELSGHFNAIRQGTAVTVSLDIPIPEQLVPTNGIILLGIQATAPEAIPAYATLVLEFIVESNVTSVELVFSRTYYTGTYAPSPGLTFITPISLAEGYDADVEFSLEGVDAGWFELEGIGNSRQLVLSSPIPTGVLANNQQLVFVVNAQRTGASTVRATIVISLEPAFTEGLILGFDRVSYLGSIENNLPTIEPITLREGYDLPGLELELLGELSGHFNAIRQGTAVTVSLDIPIPEQLVPTNGIILLGIQATAPEAIPAYATLVLEFIVESNVTSVELVFSRTYYTGTYAPSPGLTFITPISLAEGYDADVEFSLEGVDAGWFELEGIGNSRQLVLSSPIPTGVLANNQQLVFVVNAQRTGASTVRATIVISLEPAFTEGLILGFDRVSYLGSIENNLPTIEPITLREGYDLPGLELELLGELSGHFNAIRQGTAVTVSLDIPIPEQLVPTNGIILLGIQATAPEAIPAYATLVLEFIVESNVTSVELVFSRTYYTGTYAPSPGLTFITPISLAEGYDADVEFSLEGDDAGWFELEGIGNSRQLVLSSPIPTGVLANNQQLVFVVNAQRTGASTVRATIVISLEPAFTEGLILGFDRVSYLGSIENNLPTIEPITLREGYDLPGLELELLGELSGHFNAIRQGTAVTVSLDIPIPEQLVPTNGIILLGIQATAPEAIPAYATLVLELIVESNVTSVELVFSRTYYTGTYTPSPGLTFVTPISLAEGYDADVEFSLEGDDAGWFELEGIGNSRQLVLSSPIPTGVLANNQQLVFVVNAQRTGSTTVRATIVISLEPEFTEGLILGFDRVSYLGSIENNLPTIEPITLREGYDLPGLELELLGELSGHFNATRQGTAVTVSLDIPIPEQLVPANGIILLGIQATAPEAIPAYATLVLEFIVESNVTSVELVFARTYYTGTYAPSPGLTFVTPISLAVGYDGVVQFGLEGNDAEWFSLEGTGNSQLLVLYSHIPVEVLANNQHLVFVVTAQRIGSTTATATIVISLVIDSPIQPDVYFEKTIFEGIIQNAVVSHEPIRLFGFTGGAIELVGEFSSLFEAGATNGLVTVTATEPFSLPQGNTHVVLELQAGTAKSVIIFNVIQNDGPATPPVVTFSATSYAVRVEVSDTGLVGHVQAEADNGEAVRYTLQLTSEHLQQRLSVNDLGELHLSAPANSGRYTFLVEATTIFTQASGTATVHLSVEAVTVCGEDIVMPPLIVLDRDEEEPHFNLVNAYEGCHFSLSNRWPEDQAWLFVNETGLHTSSIDREHESIAFMALSQVQVEITLHCDTDATRIKRSLYSLNSQALTLNDFGTSKWILTDTILYNSRRSLVNLIVNDINDNAPIFEGKDQEPIAVGYPVPELEEKVLPRSLAELQATDADIGENAELLYWSSESVLAVAPTTGFVHVRDTAILEHGSRLTVNATDRNGQGLTGSIDIVVRLLDQSNILVVTVRDTFLHDEKNVLSRLSESVGYQIKVLRSVVVSNEEIAGRTKREAGNPGASLQLYVYGLIEREPVTVEQLTVDINAAIAEVNIASAVSLEDHLAAQEICVIPGRDTGLLVATIILSVLLFIIIVLIAVWFFLRWRKGKNYNQFSDANSLASRNESIEEISKPAEVSTKPRLNIEALKKSEKRLREILEAPVEDVLVEPATSRSEAILDMPLPMDTNTPIVIQSIDKLKDAADDSSDDEFGERKRPKRKSVVTFNENVEKIIHVEETDPEDISTSPGYEIYKL